MLIRRAICWSLVGLIAITIGSTFVRADLPYEQDPIHYTKTPPADPIALLQKRIETGEVKLKHDEKFGYLPALLENLKVPVSSQGLVFSKTSLQRSRIAPRTPRAIYFNDDVYIGYVQNSDILELSAVDPRQGAMFYTLSQEESEVPNFQRNTDNCLICHSSTKTLEVPGHLVRSLFTDRAGQPVFSAGTYNTNHDSPFRERWGGWYVTGKHGRMEHMGNTVVRDTQKQETIDRAEVANTVDLTSRFNTSAYLTKHSDITALMVLEHQTHMHNLITRANYEGRMALHYNETMIRAFNEAADHRFESVTRRINHAAESMLKYLLFTEEASLDDPVEGTAGFAKDFAAQGPRDSRGRSLRDLDMQTRMFKYPCSYLIYSAAFDELPTEVKARFYRRLWEILKDEDKTKDYARLTAADRAAIYEILRDTKQGLPDYWK